MIFYVKRMRHLGKPLDHKQLREVEAMRCDIAINHESCVMGRSSVVAKVRGDWPLADSALPPLLDVQLHSMAPNGMVLSGIEVIEGVAYAQSWLCKAPD